MITLLSEQLAQLAVLYVDIIDQTLKGVHVPLKNTIKSSFMGAYTIKGKGSNQKI